MEKKLKDVAEIRFCLVQKESSDVTHKVLTPIKLLENNVIEDIVLDNKTRADETTKVRSKSIIIKRISPSFINYIDQIDDDVYAAGNLIIVTAKTVDPKYLAYILNTVIPQITRMQSGAKIPSVGRSDLEEISIPILSMKEQKAVGELWQKGIELYKLKNRLNELEMDQNKELLSKVINGGKKNGNKKNDF